MAETFLFNALRAALDEEMERDPAVFVLGEDVGHYGGSYKVTKDLYKKYGEIRLLDTPICENSFTGMAIGAAMTGLRPVIEGMNMGFLLLAFNQIANNAGMLRYTSGGNFKIPLVIRGPGGVGRQLGAEHSQRLEAYFQAVPGLKIVACSTPYNAKGLLKSAIRDDNPVLFFVIGSSPEVMVKLSRQGSQALAMVRPIAGTRPRGQTAAEDQALAAELLQDPKELAEHVMLVDLGRNDLGRVCTLGSVKVEQLMQIERYSHVMHIVSQVVGQGQGRDGAWDVLKATFPAGTVTGAPKIRAMQIIWELEGCRRGPYSGAYGFYDFRGQLNTAITIRTLWMQGDQVIWQAGAGIVADSDPQREQEECLNKAKGLLTALAHLP